MRCRLKELYKTFDGKQSLVIELDEDFGKAYVRLNNKELEVRFKEYHPKRSLDANAYFWVLCNKLAEVLGIPKSQIYQNYIREIGGNSHQVLVRDDASEDFRKIWEGQGLGWITESLVSQIKGYQWVRCYKGSSVYDTAQMSRLIDMAVYDCKEHGIDVMSDEERTLLLDKWEGK